MRWRRGRSFALSTCWKCRVHKGACLSINHRFIKKAGLEPGLQVYFICMCRGGISSASLLR